MSEREKGPGPTLPEAMWADRDGDGKVEVHTREPMGWPGRYTRYVRADLAPDPERERLVETIRALVTTEDDGPEGAMGARWILGQVRAALEAHDAKGAGR